MHNGSLSADANDNLDMNCSNSLIQMSRRDVEYSESSFSLALRKCVNQGWIEVFIAFHIRCISTVRNLF